MKNNASISGALAGLLLAFLDAKNLAAPECRERLSKWKLDGHVAMDEWVTCLFLIRQAYPSPTLGLEIGQFFQPEYAGLLGYLCLSCNTVGDIVERFERFFPLMWRGFTLQVESNAEYYSASWALSESPAEELLASPLFMEIRRLACETGAAGMLSFIHRLCGEDVIPSSATIIGNPPENMTVYEEFFGCPVQFHKTTISFTVSKQLFSKPISLDKAYLLRMFEHQAENELREVARGDSFLIHFNKAMSRGLHTGLLSVTCIAHELDMSRATLQRKLKDRGMTFQFALDQARIEKAKVYLEDPRVSLAEISLLLAFSEQSAFTRFFKREMHMTPMQYRQEVCG
ncbi:MAG: AraC family transcriptional regulator ligand-binding domain-containing protein [Gammaproteobacteria bacterium]|nr:AraC family transcriptional regulator ligand-binding domain-containing protein [Gammaproteobacteria bacterium]